QVARGRAQIADAAAAETGRGRRVGLPLVLAVGLVVDPADVDQHLELELGLVAQRAADVDQEVSVDPVAELAGARRQPLELRAELGLDGSSEGRVLRRQFLVLHSLDDSYFRVFFGPISTNHACLGRSPGSSIVASRLLQRAMV